MYFWMVGMGLLTGLSLLRPDSADDPGVLALREKLHDTCHAPFVRRAGCAAADLAATARARASLALWLAALRHQPSFTGGEPRQEQHARSASPALLSQALRPHAKKPRKMPERRLAHVLQ